MGSFCMFEDKLEGSYCLPKEGIRKDVKEKAAAQNFYKYITSLTQEHALPLLSDISGMKSMI